MSRHVITLGLLAALAAAAPAAAAVRPGTYEGRVGDVDATATIARSTCVVPASLASASGPRTKAGLCFAFQTSTYFDIRCTNDGRREDTRLRIVDRLRVPRSGEIDVVQRTTSRVAGVRKRSTTRTTTRLRVGRDAIAGSVSHTADLHNLAGHTECAGRVAFRLARTGGA